MRRPTRNGGLRTLSGRCPRCPTTLLIPGNQKNKEKLKRIYVTHPNIDEDELGSQRRENIIMQEYISTFPKT